jgi:hypothetical protein
VVCGSCNTDLRLAAAAATGVCERVWGSCSVSLSREVVEEEEEEDGVEGMGMAVCGSC